MLDIRMKERLTGAIILVALLVLLVPELLTGPGRSAPSSQMAANDGAQVRTYTIDLGDSASHPRTAPPAVETPSSAPTDAGVATESDAGFSVSRGESETPQASLPTPRAEPPPKAIEPKPEAPPKAVAPKPEPARLVPARPAVAASPPAEPAAEPRVKSGWAVQVGSFASRENADRLARELRGKGFAATVSESSSKGKRLWRVRVGPEGDRAGAVSLGAKLRAAGHSGGAVVPYP